MSDLFDSCSVGHPDDHWQLDPLCQAPTLVADHRNRPEPPVCGLPLSSYEHNDSPPFDEDSAERKHEFVPPTEPLVWGENAWRTNACPGVERKPEWGIGDVWCDGDKECHCPCHRRVHYVNVYELDQGYGGPEEGGWYYEAGTPIASVPFDTLREAEAEQEKLKERFPDGHNRYSVAPREPDYGVYIEGQFAAPFPEYTPRYS